jgi:hypothetical protein
LHVYKIPNRRDEALCTFICGGESVLADTRAEMTPNIFEVIMFLTMNQDLQGVFGVARAIKKTFDNKDGVRNDR